MPFAPSSSSVARREHGRVTSAGPVELTLASQILRSRDAHDVRLSAAVTVRLHEGEIDRSAFADRFLRTRMSANAEDVATFIAGEMAPAFETVAGAHDASTLLDGPPEEAVETLRVAARRVAFGVGLQLDRDLKVSAESASLARRRVEEAAEAARLAAAEREGELLRRFEDIRRQNPTVPAGAMLMGLPEPDRRDVLLALLKAAGKDRNPPLFVVAGDGLFRVDIAADSADPLPLPNELGPLRSIRAVVRSGRPALLIGARDGVYLADPRDAASAEIFDADVSGSPYGFSHLTFDAVNDLICARHVDAGFLSWQVGLGTRLVYTADDFGGDPPMPVAASDGQVFVGAGPWIYRLVPGAPPERMRKGKHGSAQFIHPMAGELVVVWQDGTVTRSSTDADASGPTPDELLARFPYEHGAYGLLPWLGDERLLISDRDRGELTMLGTHDDVRLILQTTSGPLRALASSPAIIAGTSEDRQRLLAWHPWEEKPYADIHLISRLRSRAADLAFLPESDAGAPGGVGAV